MKTVLIPLLSLSLSVGLAAPSSAGAVGVTLVLKDHRFTPAEIQVPPDQKIEIRLINRDAALEEFDSDDLASRRM